MPPKPHYITQEWVVPGHPHVHIQLTERPGINFYTSVEIVQDDGARVLIRESARGHENIIWAENRIETLLGGGWRDWVKETDT